MASDTLALMAVLNMNLLSADELAELVVSDIGVRKLVPGDRYFTVEEARLRFGVPRTAMNNAMRLLSDREVLIRRQKAGTFVGPRAETSAMPQSLVKIFVLSSAAGAGTYVDADDLIEVLWQEFPGLAVEFVRLPAESPAKYVRTLIDRATNANELIGFIPISAPRDVYALLATSQIPSVVLGSVGPEIGPSLCWVDVDYAAAGRTLVDYVLSQGRQRISVLMPEAWLHGDNQFYESIRLTMGEAGLPVTSLCVRSLPSDPELFRGHVRLLLQQADRPGAIISRQGLFRSPRRSSEKHWAPALVAEVAGELGLSVPGDLMIAYDLGRDLPADPLPFPCTHRLESWPVTLRKVAYLMHAMIEGGPRDERCRRVLPVGLYVPAEVEAGGSEVG